MAVPAPIMTSASRTMSQTTAARVAPSASRTPISCVRCVTTNDITPYRPTTERREGYRSEPARQRRQHPLGSSTTGRSDPRTSSAKTGRVGSTCATAARIERERGFRPSSHLQIERAIARCLVPEREEHLFELLITKAATAEVPDHSDDLDIGRRVRPIAHTQTGARPGCGP